MSGEGRNGEERTFVAPDPAPACLISGSYQECRKY
jgi:hypothetical protein